MDNRAASKKKISFENQIVNVLLPACVGAKHDVFFNVLRNVISRVGKTKMAEFYLDNALKAGLIAEEICVDVIASNLEFASKYDGIQQTKTLGFWTFINCPTFGKIFYGDNWQPSNRCDIKVREINAMIFPKMKCRMVQLNVCESTKQNLKHFVKIPTNEIGVCNGLKVSTIMKLFDIKEEFQEKCWAALKRGKWLADTEVRNVFRLIRAFFSPIRS